MPPLTNPSATSQASGRRIPSDPGVVQQIDALCESAYQHRGRARAEAEAALELASSTDDPGLVARARVYLGGHFALLEDSAAARPLLQEAQEFYDAEGIVDVHVARMHHFWGMCLACERNFLDAHHHFSKALQFASELDEPYDQQLNLDFTGYNYIEMGMAKEAISFLLQSIEHPHADIRLICNSNLALVEAYMLRGEWDQATTHVELAFAVIDTSRDVLAGRYAAAASYGAMVAVRQGRITEARDYLDRVEALDQTDDASESFPGMFDIATAEVLIAEGRFSEAMATCGRIINRSNREWSRAVGKMLMAEALSKRGMFSEATAIFEAADSEALSFFYNDKLHRLMIEHYQRMNDWRSAFGVLQRHNELRFVRQTNVSALVEIETREQHERTIRKKNEQLEELLQEKNELLQLVAHDLNNPITAILLSAQLADHLLASGNDDKLAAAITRIEESAQHTADIAAQIVIMSKLDENKVAIHPQTIAADELVLKALDRATGQMESKRITCEIDMDSGLFVSADRLLLSQIFDNLVSNSVKYSPFDSNIEVHGRGLDGTVKFSFVDHGVGIDPSEMSKLFSKFGRLSQRPTNGESSTGLGLYNTRRQLELINATITAHSEGIGQGTTFVVTLPRVVPATVATPAAP